MVLIDVSKQGMTGAIAESALEECSIIINKNRIPNDRHSPLVTSGIRLGTNGLALRGMNSAAMGRCVELIDTVLSSLEVQGKTEYRLDPGLVTQVRREVEWLCARYPIPHYPLVQSSALVAELQDICLN